MLSTCVAGDKWDILNCTFMLPSVKSRCNFYGKLAHIPILLRNLCFTAGPYPRTRNTSHFSSCSLRSMPFCLFSKAAIQNPGGTMQVKIQHSPTISTISQMLVHVDRWNQNSFCKTTFKSWTHSGRHPSAASLPRTDTHLPQRQDTHKPQAWGLASRRWLREGQEETGQGYGSNAIS